LGRYAQAGGAKVNVQKTILIVIFLQHSFHNIIKMLIGKDVLYRALVSDSKQIEVRIDYEINATLDTSYQSFILCILWVVLQPFNVVIFIY
jgi:hypothetical protein